MDSSFWRPLAGTATWAAAAVVPLAAVARGTFGGAAFVAWMVAWLVFQAAFLARYHRRTRSSAAGDLTLLVVQSVASLGAAAASPDRLSAAILLVVVAGQLSRAGVRVSAAWLSVQTFGLIGLLLQTMTPASAITFGVAFGGLQAFALGTAVLAERERAGRHDLAAIALELTATRSKLADETRASERLRISRDLHDALGHHLTALSVQLDIASRLSDGTAAAHVQQAHALTRLLLADVRAVVGELRAADLPDLSGALQALADRAAPAIVVAVEIDSGLPGLRAAQAEVLLRFAQEVITNAIRHARATTMTLRLHAQEDGVQIVAHDNGAAVPPVPWGLGLTGMRERFEGLGGHLDVTTSPGGGLRLTGWLPLTDGTR